MSGRAEPATLDDARRAFETGDFRAVRAITERLAREGDAETAAKARALAAQVGVDPIAIGVLVVCFVFLALVVARYVL